MILKWTVMDLADKRRRRAVGGGIPDVTVEVTGCPDDPGFWVWQAYAGDGDTPVHIEPLDFDGDPDMGFESMSDAQEDAEKRLSVLFRQHTEELRQRSQGSPELFTQPLAEYRA